MEPWGTRPPIRLGEPRVGWIQSPGTFGWRVCGQDTVWTTILSAPPAVPLLSSARLVFQALDE